MYRFQVSGTGMISTTSSLDYEERSLYHLTLIARDGGGTLTNPNQATTQIVIQVVDVNDHTPVCFPPSTVVALEENRMYANFLTISVSGVFMHYLYKLLHVQRSETFVLNHRLWMVTLQTLSTLCSPISSHLLMVHLPLHSSQ